MKNISGKYLLLLLRSTYEPTFNEETLGLRQKAMCMATWSDGITAQAEPAFASVRHYIRWDSDNLLRWTGV